MPPKPSFDLPSLAHVGLALASPYVGRKKAFLIGIEDGGQLQGSHDDIRSFRTLLIEKGFDPENIIMMLDDGVAPEPTGANIIDVLKTWLVGQCVGDIFVFVYAGHATQEPCLDGTERDNLDELIVASDNERIKDDDLHKYLVEPLRSSSTLVAIFDSCHSQDILDLNHDRCNRLGHFRRSLRSLREMAGWRVPARRSCHGYCPRIDNDARHPNVICISACKDSQQVFEAKGNSMLHAVTEFLRSNEYDQKYPTLKTLMRVLKFVISE
ncbi:peptidase C14, caspase domain-containing protein [Mycena filopes]|nr:peptidase C14, caspase domain-containing protein [Mycena filopes]